MMAYSIDNGPPPAPVDEKLAELLREIYERAPLYRKYAWEPAGYQTRPAFITLYCPVCKHDQPFEPEREGSSTFECRACRKANVVFYLYWGETGAEKWIMKVGQYPPMEERFPIELEQRLGAEDLDRYKKALRSRNFNFGLGALSYLRRVVENKTNDLLDMIAEAAAAGGVSDIEKRVAEAKASYRFEDKVALAAELLPKALRPGDINPLDALHDLASSGIHWKSEEDA